MNKQKSSITALVKAGIIPSRMHTGLVRRGWKVVALGRGCVCRAGVMGFSASWQPSSDDVNDIDELDSTHRYCQPQLSILSQSTINTDYKRTGLHPPHHASLNPQARSKSCAQIVANRIIW
jgi:hypothetical protein